MRRFSFFVILFLSLNNILFMKSLKSNDFENVKIISCYDGDTCTSSEGEKIRLACIDTPEIRGNKINPEEALQAKEFLNSKVKGKYVSLKRITTDRYGRTVAELFIDDINIQKLLVNKGYAKVYERYSYQCDWTKK